MLKQNLLKESILQSIRMLYQLQEEVMSGIIDMSTANAKEEILKKEKLTDIKNLFFQKVEIPELNISFIGNDETETEAKMQASFKALNYFNKFKRIPPILLL